MIAIGIDPSLTRTAVAIADDTGVTVRSLPTKGSTSDTTTQRRDRLLKIRRFVSNELVGLGTVTAYIESPAHSQTAGAHHDRSGLWWLIVDMLLEASVPVTEISPQQLKVYATGKGNAGKDEVMLAMARRHDWLRAENNDEMDAAVLALMGARLAGHPIDGDLPRTHLRALDKITEVTP